MAGILLCTGPPDQAAPLANTVNVQMEVGGGHGVGSPAWFPHGDTYPGPPSWVTALRLNSVSSESESSACALCPCSHFLFSAHSTKGDGGLLRGGSGFTEVGHG